MTPSEEPSVLRARVVQVVNREPTMRRDLRGEVVNRELKAASPGDFRAQVVGGLRSDLSVIVARYGRYESSERLPEVAETLSALRRLTDGLRVGSGHRPEAGEQR